MKKYTDEEHEAFQNPLRCYDCGLEYGSDGWMDALIPNDVWEAINPTYHEGAGILCITCINRRCKIAGIGGVPVWITSGALHSKDSKSGVKITSPFLVWGKGSQG